MKENINLQLCNMSIILFSLLIIPFCFINIYPVNGVNTNAEYMNITNNLLECLDANINKITKELDKEKKKYTDQRNILFGRFNTDMNKIQKELYQERNQINKEMYKIDKQLEEIEESYNRINITIISLISFLVGVGITLTINKFEKSQK